MSAIGSEKHQSDVLRQLQLRSATPRTDEKVFLYLDSMVKTPPGPEDNARAASIVSSRRSEISRVSSRRPPQPGDGHDEIRSDVQENNQSEVARTIPINTTGFQEQEPDHEPGPNDPPYIRPGFESYTSSFGNFGPLRDSMPPVNGYNLTAQPWQPSSVSKAAGVPLPTSSPTSPTLSHPNPFGEFGMAPLDPAAIPLPMSVASGPSRRTGADAMSNGLLSPKAPSRAMSPGKSMNGNGSVPERPFSPRSAASLQPSRLTQKSSRTAYPPLPGTPVGEDPRSPSLRPQRRPSIAHSVTPSESASNAGKPPKEPSVGPPKSVKNPTEVNEGGADLARNTVSRSRVATSQREIRSQAPMSPRSQVSRAPSRHTNDELARAAERELVDNFLMRPSGTRTSYAPSAAAPSMLEPEIQNTHFHDGELCQLLHALDQPMAEPVKKAIRKAVRARVKRLGMKYDNESIRQYRKSYHDHSPSVHLTGDAHSRISALPSAQDAPEWARDLLENVIHLAAKVDQVDNKVDRVVELRSSRGAGGSLLDARSITNGHHRHVTQESRGGFTQSPMSQTANLQTMPSEGAHDDDDMYTEARGNIGPVHHEDYYDDEDARLAPTTHDGDTRGLPSDYNEREYSPGQQYLEEELYKLRVKPTAGSQSVATHKTWEVARDDGGEFEEGETQAAVTDSGLPEIPDTQTGNFERDRSLPPLPRDAHGGDLLNVADAHAWPVADFSPEARGPAPWQRIHQRLLNWAVIWPMSELENALNSTTRGHQVDEIALSIWSIQTYKRYVRAKMTENPPERVDRLFVPPNMAEAISTAVFNGRHGDASGMLKELWAPFGLEGMPRLLIVLAKHRTDENHYVAHRFSLPDGSLTTYDTYPERALPDGRPLGWWFAIRMAWPDAIYPSPERLLQKMVRLHRPMQLAIDNSVAAAGIWRNLLMGSRAERSLDLERLRDLINQEVKNLRQRKLMGKLTVTAPQTRPNWEDLP
ncbi:hypothetical protein NM688_g5051 [Phlebia brevispora]|uniref:Uncharacterized protein n=1 Tax=Phlebia brevispora TaxID=194682 RepID=A0ACC1T1A4_9APHY|nr:hypothetical protein NM688_g5051 [Phlebia brevispora]